MTDSSDLEPLTFNLKLLGKHQLRNATTALAALMVLREQGSAISKEVICQGLETVEWHGRFEILERDPFVIADGAHNVDSAHQLIETLRDLLPRSRLHFIFGASNDKDSAGMFAELLPHAESLTLTRSHHPRAADPAHLARFASEYRVVTSIAPDVAAALSDARRRTHRNDVVCITGSLFVVADAREAWFAEHGKTVEKDF